MVLQIPRRLRIRECFLGIVMGFRKGLRLNLRKDQ